MFGGSLFGHPCEETYLPEPIEPATGATCIPRGGFAGLSGRNNFGQIDILVCVLTSFSIQFNSFLGHLYPCLLDVLKRCDSLNGGIWPWHELSWSIFKFKVKRLYNGCTNSFSRGSCSVAASSPQSRASGGRWFGAAMPQAGRAAVGFAKLFELSLLRRFGGCKTQVLYMGWWRLRQICSSLSVQWCSMSNDLWVCGFLRLPHLCLRPQNATEWMTRNFRGLGPRDLLYCSVHDRRLDRFGQEWTHVWLAADEACLHHGFNVSLMLFLQ